MSTLRQENKSIYWAWKSMKQRCLNQKCRAYHNYGARGINICPDWMTFEPFCYWAIENGYQKGLELDRIDNNGPYAPDNCRWATRHENLNNRRMTIHITVNGETLSATEWASKIGVDRHIIYLWIKTRGINYAVFRIEEALENGYFPNDFSRNHDAYRIKCIETGESYDSINEAGRILNLNNGNISRVINYGGTTGGYHFVREDDAL